MQELFKQIKETNKRIATIESQFEDVKTMPYYSIFGNAREKEKDLETCLKAMKDQLDLKDLLLQNLQIEINKDRQLISTNQRKLSLQKLTNGTRN